MLLKCQHFYTLGVEVYFTRIRDFTWRLSDCEELAGLLTGDDGVGFRGVISLF